MESYSIPDVDDLYCNFRVADRRDWRSYPRYARELSGDGGDDYLNTRVAFGRAFSDVGTNPAQELYDLCSMGSPGILNTNSLPRFHVAPEGLYTGIPLRDPEAEVPRDSAGFPDAYWSNLQAHRARGVGYGDVFPPQFRNGDASEFKQEGFGYGRFGIHTGDKQHHSVLPSRTRLSEKDSSKTPFSQYQRVDHDYLFETFGGEDSLGDQFQPLSPNGWNFYHSPGHPTSDPDNMESGASSTSVHQTLPPSSQRCETIDGEDHEDFENLDNLVSEEHPGSPDRNEKLFDSEDDSSYVPKSDIYADTSDFPGSFSFDDYSPFTDPELSTEEAPSSDPAYPPRSSSSSSSPPPLQFHRHTQNSIPLQWRWIMAMISSLRRQRRRLRQERDLLRRQKAALDLEWRDLQQTQRRGPYRRRRSKRRYRNYNSDAYGTDYFRKGEGRYNGKNVWTSHGKSKAKARADRCSYDDQDSTDGEDMSDHMPEPTQFLDPISPMTRPHLTAAAIAEANIAIQSYETAWACLSSSTTPVPTKIPYPSSDHQPEGLLAQFPSCVSLPPCPVQRPSAHARIQFFALEFYLRPLGMQPQPMTEKRDLPLWSIGGIKEVREEVLEKVKVMMDKEVGRWHEDRLRNKGFGEVFDGNGTVLELENEPFKDHTCDNKQCRLGRLDELKWTSIKEKEVVQGVWAAVRLLRGCVTKEMDERKRKRC